MARLSEVHPGNYVFYGAFTKYWFFFFLNGLKTGLLLCFRCAAVRYRLVSLGGRGCEGVDPGHRSLSSQESAPDRLWMVWTQVPSSNLGPILCFQSSPVDNEQILMSKTLVSPAWTELELFPLDTLLSKDIQTSSTGVYSWFILRTKSVCDECLMEMMSHQVGVDDSGTWQSGAHLRTFGLR